MDWNEEYAEGERAKDVVPHAGTWIEIFLPLGDLLVVAVVPHAGPWIEILVPRIAAGVIFVVPHAGTWIEIETRTW